MVSMSNYTPHALFVEVDKWGLSQFSVAVFTDSLIQVLWKMLKIITCFCCCCCCCCCFKVDVKCDSSDGLRLCQNRRWLATKTLHWRHNERDCVTNHRCLDCLLNRLFRLTSKNISKLRFTGVFRGIHRWPVLLPSPVVLNSHENINKRQLMWFHVSELKTCVTIGSFTNHGRQVCWRIWTLKKVGIEINEAQTGKQFTWSPGPTFTTMD